MTNEEQFLNLQNFALRSALDPLQWPKFLEALSAACNQNRVHFISVRHRNIHSVSHLTHQYSPEALKAWDSHFAAINAWQQGFSNAEVGRVLHSEEMCSEDKLLKTEFYNDWVLPQEDARKGGGAIISRTGEEFVALGLNMRARDADTNLDSALALIQRLVPLIQHASAVNRRLLYQELISSAPTEATLLISSDRKILTTNAAAEDLLDKGEHLHCDQSGRLRFVQKKNDLRLSKLIYQFAQGQSVMDTFLIKNDQVLDSLICDCVPVGLVHQTLEAVLGMSGSPTISVTLRRRLDIESSITRLMAATNMSLAEANITKLLALGMNTREIALSRKVSEQTVRNQIKSAMSRCGVGSRSMLVRLAIELAN